MIDQDKKKFAEVLTIAAEATGFQMSDSTYKTYWAILNRLSIEDFELAISKHLLDPNDGMFFPKPANIMKQLEGTTKQKEQSLESRAEIAWQTVEGEISRIGSYGALELEDCLALASVRAMGGWKYLCSLTMDKMTWARKEFISSYKNYENTPLEALPNKLPGRIDIENAKKNGSGQGIHGVSDLIKKLQDKGW